MVLSCAATEATTRRRIAARNSPPHHSPQRTPQFPRSIRPRKSTKLPPQHAQLPASCALYNTARSLRNIVPASHFRNLSPQLNPGSRPRNSTPILIPAIQLATHSHPFLRNSSPLLFPASRATPNELRSNSPPRAITRMRGRGAIPADPKASSSPKDAIWMMIGWRGMGRSIHPPIRSNLITDFWGGGGGRISQQ